MIDTRDLKTSGYNTKFCHHFYFLPEKIDGIQCGEVTRFRTEDTHELCDPQFLQVESHKHSSGYRCISLFLEAAYTATNLNNSNELGLHTELTVQYIDPSTFLYQAMNFKLNSNPPFGQALNC